MAPPYGASVGPASGVEGEIARVKKLGNPQFVAKAAEEVVEAEREKAELDEQLARLRTALTRVS